MMKQQLFGGWIFVAMFPSALLDMADFSDQTKVIDNSTYVEVMTALEKFLLEGPPKYDTEARPVKNVNDTVNVKFLFAIYHIEEVNELEQTATIHGYLYMNWKDALLKWNPEDFSGQDQIDLPPWRIWRPDINLYNSASGKDDWHFSMRYPARIDSSGRVLYWPPATFRVTCFFDFSEFPNDVHTCPIVIGSWKYYKEQVNYEWSPGKPRRRLAYRSDKVHVAGWELLDLSTSTYYWGSQGRSETTTNETSHWVELVAFVKLRRHAPYFGTMFVLPSVVASAFTLFAMFQQSGEAGILVLLINIVLQAIMTRALVLKLPPSANVTPKIVCFYGFNLSMTFVGIFLIIIRAAFSTTRLPMPRPLKVFANFMDSMATTILTTLHLRDSKPKSVQTVENPNIILTDTKTEDQLTSASSSAAALAKRRKDDVVSEDWQRFAQALHVVIAFLYALLYVIMMSCFLA